MATNSPLISIIVPYHNEGILLNRAIRSIWTQNYRGPIEVIVVDDCSEIEPDLSSEMRLSARVVRTQRNLHAAGARNYGVQLSRGDYVCFLDADDEFLESRIASHVDFLERHPEAVMVASPYLVTRGDKTETISGLYFHRYLPGKEDSMGLLPESLRHDICSQFTFHTNVVTIRRSSFDQVGGFDERYRCWEDWDLFVRIAQVGRVGWVPTVVMHYHCREGSITTTRDPGKHESGWRMYRKWRKQIVGLPRRHRLALRLRQAKNQLLAAQVHYEEHGRVGRAWCLALRSLSRPTIWGLRSLARYSLAGLSCNLFRPGLREQSLSSTKS